MSRISRSSRRRFRIGCLVVILIIFVCILVFRVVFGSLAHIAFPLKYETWVEEYAGENDLPEELVYSIIYCESEFDPEAVSSVGARGLMQLMETTFDWVKDRLEGTEKNEYDDMFDPENNIRYGCRLFHLLLEEYETVPNALCAYHAGWGTARKWLEDESISPDGKNIENIPYKSTARYVDKVMRVAEIYQRLYDL